jgi:hypothetical protein
VAHQETHLPRPQLAAAQTLVPKVVLLVVVLVALPAVLLLRQPPTLLLVSAHRVSLARRQLLSLLLSLSCEVMFFSRGLEDFIGCMVEHCGGMNVVLL